MKKNISSLVVLLLAALSVSGTHLRGGYIRVISQSESFLAHVIEVTLFTDSGSAVFAGGGELALGDGTVGILKDIADEPKVVDVGPEVTIHQFFVHHTYQGAGSYTLSYSENNRNEGVLNLEKAIEMPFYTETTFSIDPAFGANSTPGLLAHPAVFSKAGSTFYNSVAAWDVENDSLVYGLSTPLGHNGDSPVNFKWPNDESFYTGEMLTEEPAFSLHKLSGELEWDTPLIEGEFALAYKISEYRKTNGNYFKISETTVDLHIVNRVVESSLPAINFNFLVLEEGTIDFTLNLESSVEEDTLEWLFYSNATLESTDIVLINNQVADTVNSGYSLTGVLSSGVSAKGPTVVVVSARSLLPGALLKSVRSFAIHPKGRDYVLTSLDGFEVGIVLFPNPTGGMLHVLMPQNPQTDQIVLQLINVADQSILNTVVPVRGNLATLDIHHLVNGTYMVKLIAASKIYGSKIIKN